MKSENVYKLMDNIKIKTKNKHKREINNSKLKTYNLVNTF